MNFKTYLPIAILIALVALVCVACNSTPQRVTYNVLAGTEITVDQAMQAWGAYVAEFHPTAAVEQQVEDAYEKYQAAEEEAIDAAQLVIALNASGNTNAASGAQTKSASASQASAQALVDLIGLLRNFGVKI